MKKNLKKSLSLFLAVLMMLSCWVWVAPQKAEAGAPDSYTVTVDYWVNGMTAADGSADEVRLKAWTRSDNGTGSEVEQTQYGSGSCVGEGSGSSFSATYDHWPSRVYFEATTATSSVLISSDTSSLIFSSSKTSSSTTGASTS